MNPYEIAAEMLGDVTLSSWQVAELRAIDRKYQQRLFTLLHRGGDRAGPGAEGAVTAEEAAELRHRVVTDILAMLTPEQRRILDQR